MAHREHRQKLALANKAIAEAQEKIAFAKAEVQKAELQKRALIAETASLEGKPRERASQRTDLDQIQEARRKAVRYYYALGCRFAGKGTKNQEGSDVS
jgi:multidrug efflux pump subunit AcrA (membrane-fusion protein)